MGGMALNEQPDDEPKRQITDFALEDLPPGLHRDLYTLWLGKCPPGQLPSRTDIDPIEMPKLLPYIILVDVERDPWRFRARVFGTAIVDAIGFDPTDRYLEDTDGTERIQRRAEVLATTARPYFMPHEPSRWSAHDFKHYSTLGLPLSSDGASVDKLIYSMVFG